MKREELISFAMDFASFLVRKNNDINKIILHGSVARGDFDKSSDIDLFIDINEKNKKKIEGIEKEFYKTEVYKNWKLKDLRNELSLIVGRLDSKEWKNLKRSILNTGILLYGKYKSNIKKSNQYVIYVFENIRPESKRIALHRKFFGFKQNKKKYPGILETINGVKLGKSSIMVDIEYSKRIKDIFKEKGITPKIYDVWSDGFIG